MWVCARAILDGRRKSGQRAGWGHLDQGIAERPDVACAIVEESHLDHPVFPSRAAPQKER